MLVEKLEKIGLNRSQARAYKVLLDKGWMLPSQLAKELNLSQTAAKNILESLLKEELLKTIRVKKKLYFCLNIPEKLNIFFNKKKDKIVKDLEDQKDVLESLKSEIRLMYGSFDGLSAFFVDGIENIKDIHALVLNSKSKDVYEIVPFDNVHLKPRKGDHRNQMKTSGKKFFVLYTSSKGPILKSEPNVKRYYLEEGRKRFIATEILILDKEVIFFPGNKSKIMVIKDPGIAKTMRGMFNLMKQHKKVKLM